MSECRHISSRRKDLALFGAAEEGHVDCVKTLVEEGADVNRSNDRHETVLMKAAGSGHVNVVDVLLKAGADVNRPDDDGDTALIQASVNGQVDCVKSLIKAGADVNAVNGSRFRYQTALIVAANGGHYSCVEALIHAGADVNKVDSRGKSSVMSAAENCYGHVVKYLLDKGACVNDHGNVKVLLKVAMHGSLEVINYIVQAGADINETNDDSETTLFQVVKKNCSEAVECLVKAGADIYLADVEGFTPLDAAVRLGHDGCLRELIKGGADVNKVGPRGVKPVLFAAGYYGTLKNNTGRSRQDCMKLLLEAGADVNLVDSKGCTPLMYAAVDDCIKLSSIQALLRAGAHVNVRDSDGNNAVERYLEIEEEPDEDTIMLLIAAGEKTTDTTVEVWSEEAGDLVDMGFKEKLNLKHLCRDAIRDHLLNVCPINLYCRIPQLKLPSLVTDYLLYNVSLDRNYDSDDSIDDSDAADKTSDEDENNEGTRDATDDYMSRMDDDDEEDNEWKPLKL